VEQRGKKLAVGGSSKMVVFEEILMKENNATTRARDSNEAMLDSAFDLLSRGNISCP